MALHGVGNSDPVPSTVTLGQAHPGTFLCFQSPVLLFPSSIVSFVLFSLTGFLDNGRALTAHLVSELQEEMYANITCIMHDFDYYKSMCRQ